MTATDKIQDAVFKPEHIAVIDELDKDCDTRQESADMIADYVEGLGLFDGRTLRHVNYYEIAKTVRS